MREVTQREVEVRAGTMHRRACRVGCTERAGRTWQVLAERDLEAEARNGLRDRAIAFATLIRAGEVIAGTYDFGPGEVVEQMLEKVIREVDASIQQLGAEATLDHYRG